MPLSVGVNVITVTASNAAGYSGAATLTVTRTQPGTLQFSNSAYQLDESAGSATFSVTRAGGSDGAVSVAWATSNGTAVAGVDYTASSGTLNWAAGDASTKTIAVPLLPGTTSSGDSAFNVTLSAPAERRNARHARHRGPHDSPYAERSLALRAFRRECQRRPWPAISPTRAATAS